MSASPSPEPRPKRVTPFLVRVFVRSGTYHPIELFQESHTLPLSDEYGVYVWPTSTLSTILASLFPALPAPLQNPSNKYAFRSVYFDARAGTGDDRAGRDAGAGRSWRSRELGRIDGRDFVRDLGVIERSVLNLFSSPLKPANQVPRSSKTLEENRFHAGDFLCLSIQTPTHDHQPLAPAPIHAQQGGMRINPRVPPGVGFALGGGGGAAPRDGEKWSDARARGDAPAGGRGGFGGSAGFGIRGRGANGGDEAGWGNGRANGGAAGGADAGWGKGRRSASPARRGGDDGWGVPAADTKPADGWGAVPSRGEDKNAEKAGGW